jgi:hypothetical protein
MIDRGHDLPITKQAAALNISLGRSITCPGRCRQPTSRSCGGLASSIWSSPSPAVGCCATFWLPREQDRPPACHDADEAEGDRGALSSSPHDQARTWPQDLSVSAATQRSRDRQKFGSDQLRCARAKTGATMRPPVDLPCISRGGRHGGLPVMCLMARETVWR